MINLNSADFGLDLRIATRDVLGMYWDMVTSYKGFGHAIDTGSFDPLRFVDLPIEQADESFRKELELVCVGSAFALLCRIEDSWGEDDKFDTAHPYYRAVEDALNSGRLRGLLEFEEAVRLGLVDYPAFRAASHSLYEKYVVAYFQHLGGQGPDPNANAVSANPSLQRTPPG